MLKDTQSRELYHYKNNKLLKQATKKRYELSS